MKKIRQYFRNRKVRKLAEKCLSGQLLYSDDAIQDIHVRNAIATAKAFYEQWEKQK